MTDPLKPPIKVIAWSVPRSLSSVFTQCLCSRGNAEVFFESFATAAHGGPEKIYKTPGTVPNTVREPAHTFQYVKDNLEADYPGRKLVFLKGMAYAVDGRYDKLPEGFIHTFLIRHPAHVFPSQVKLAKSYPPMFGEISYKELIPVPGETYKEQWDLFQHVTEVLKQEAIVVDANDLVATPGATMKAYCDKIGYPYSDDMLTWEPDQVNKHKWHIANSQVMANTFLGMYKRAFESTCFVGGAKKEINYENESDEVKASIEFCLPFYEKLAKYKV